MTTFTGFPEEARLTANVKALGSTRWVQFAWGEGNAMVEVTLFVPREGTGDALRQWAEEFQKVVHGLQLFARREEEEKE